MTRKDPKLIIYETICFIGTDSREIIISKSIQSEDIGSCGTPSLPCRTIDYAIRRAQSQDKIVFKCGQQKESCKFRLKRKLRIRSKELTIQGAKDNAHSPQLLFETAELFQLTGSRSKLLIYNVTINLRWSFATVTNQESQVIFDHCKLLLKKRQYSSGVGRDLRFIRVRKFSVLKLYFDNSVITHVKFNELRVLNLILTDGLALSVEVS